ncbi:MAG: hypothetical protein ABIJ28_03475, partial [Patescibacteria group bacterium]
SSLLNIDEIKESLSEELPLLSLCEIKNQPDITINPAITTTKNFLLGKYCKITGLPFFIITFLKSN